MPFRSRGDLLDEHLQAWATLWRDTPASYAGRHYLFRDVYFEPKAFRPEGPTVVDRRRGMHRRMTERIVTYGAGFSPLGLPSAGGDGSARRRDASRGPGPPHAGTRRRHPGHLPGPDSVADLGQALATIPPQIAAGFTTFCIKPSQFTDDPADVGRLCREIMRRADGLLP